MSMTETEVRPAGGYILQETTGGTLVDVTEGYRSITVLRKTHTIRLLDAVSLEFLQIVREIFCHLKEGVAGTANAQQLVEIDDIIQMPVEHLRQVYRRLPSILLSYDTITPPLWGLHTRPAPPQMDNEMYIQIMGSLLKAVQQDPSSDEDIHITQRFLLLCIDIHETTHWTLSSLNKQLPFLTPELPSDPFIPTVANVGDSGYQVETKLFGGVITVVVNDGKLAATNDQLINQIARLELQVRVDQQMWRYFTIPPSAMRNVLRQDLPTPLFHPHINSAPRTTEQVPPPLQHSEQLVDGQVRYRILRCPKVHPDADKVEGEPADSTIAGLGTGWAILDEEEDLTFSQVRMRGGGRDVIPGW